MLRLGHNLELQTDIFFAKTYHYAVIAKEKSTRDFRLLILSPANKTDLPFRRWSVSGCMLPYIYVFPL